MLADAVILRTRVTPVDGDAGVQMTWQIALDVDFTSVVGSGTFTTSAERDYTVKVDAGGLEAGTTNWYRFIALDGLDQAASRQLLPLLRSTATTTATAMKTPPTRPA
ncbi:PhoD-like phosphatase N-terminal domain-containing protein [Sorangium sp. So ce1128]